MTDLTAIEKPFGLLDHATKAALQTHGGPYEVFLDGKWRAKTTFTWQPAYTYRAKPQTVKPREWWIVDGLPPFEDAARAWKWQHSGRPVIHVREVLP